MGTNNPHKGHRERMKNQYFENGPQSFLDHQLLELLLFYCIPQKDTNPLAHELLSQFGSLRNVIKADRKILANTKGVGPNTAILLTLISDIYDRALQHFDDEKLLNTPAAAMHYCISLLHKQPNETICVVSLNKQGKLLGSDIIGIGTLTQAEIYPRSIMMSALKHNAHSVILCHNHPSGNLQPSIQDIEATRMASIILDAGQIRLFDHIIVGQDSALSIKSGTVILSRISCTDSVSIDRLNAETIRSIGINPDKMRRVADEINAYFLGEYD